MPAAPGEVVVDVVGVAAVTDGDAVCEEEDAGSGGAVEPLEAAGVVVDAPAPVTVEASAGAIAPELSAISRPRATGNVAVESRRDTSDQFPSR